MFDRLSAASLGACLALSVSLIAAPAVAQPPVTPDSQLAGDVPASTVIAGPRTLAAKYWGLPESVAVGGSSTPRSYPKSVWPARKAQKGSKRFLPGFRPGGLKVRRGGAPVIRSARLKKGTRYEIRARVRMQSAVSGPAKVRKRAKEQLLLSVRVLGPGKNSSRRSLIGRSQASVTLKADKASPSMRVALTKQASKVLRSMSAKDRRRSVVIDAVHIIDLDRKKVAGRWTAEHVKATSTDLQSAPTVAASGAQLASSQPGTPLSQGNQGLVLTVVNDVYYGAVSPDPVWGAPNLVTNTVSCMESSGKQGSNTDALNISGMTPSETIEAYIQGNGGSTQPTNEAPAAQDVADAVAFDFGESTIKAGLDIPLTWSGVAFDVFEELAELLFSGCSYNPAMFTIQAADNNGNSTNQGYSLSSLYTDGPYPNYNDGNKLTLNTPGGLADAVNALGWWNLRCTSEIKPKQSCAAATYIQGDFVQNNFAPGPIDASFVVEPPVGGGNIWVGGVQTGGRIAGSGGDNGLALQASNFSFTGTYPTGQLTLGFNTGCSSYIGGDDFNVNACQGWPNAPVGNPYPAPQSVDQALPTMIGQCSVGTGSLSINPGRWTVPASQLGYQWYVSDQSGNSTGTVPSTWPTGSGWTPVAGATTSTYTPSAQDAQAAGLTAAQVADGYFVTAAVGATNAAGSMAFALGAIAVGTPNSAVPPFFTVYPSIQGPAVAGQPVTVSTGSYCPNPLNISWEWFVNDRPMGVSTSYTPTTAQAGKSLWAVVSLESSVGTYEYTTLPVVIQAS